MTQVVCHGRSRTFNKNLSVMGRSHPAQGCVPTPVVPTPIVATDAEKSTGRSPVVAPSTLPSFAAKWSDKIGFLLYESVEVSSAR